MKTERNQSRKHNIVIAESNVLFRRGLCGLMNAEADFAVVGEAATEAELLVAVERHRPDAAIVTSAFLSPAGIFATTLSDRVGHSLPVVALVADHAEASFCTAAAFAIPRSQATISLVKELRNLFRPDLSAQKQASDLRALSLGSQTAAPDVLTHREKEVVRLLSDGLTVREAAFELGLSSKTVEAHTLNLMRKLDIHNRTTLIEYAIAAGIAAAHVVA